MGEDRKVSLEQREDIQNASKELLRDAQWTEGTIAGIQRGAELINQPWYRSTAFLVAAWTTVAAAVAGAATWLIVRWRTRVSSRKELARGDASYSNVSMDLQVTELNAGTIPEASRYGSTVLEKHRTFMAEVQHRHRPLQPGPCPLAPGPQQAAEPEAGPELRRRRRRTGRPRRRHRGHQRPAQPGLRLGSRLGPATGALPRRPGRDRTDAQQAPRRGRLRDGGGPALLPGRKPPGHRTVDRGTRGRSDHPGDGPGPAAGRAHPLVRAPQEPRRHRDRRLRQEREGSRGSCARKWRARRPEARPSTGGRTSPASWAPCTPSYYFFSVPTFNSGFTTGVSSVSSARGGGGSTTGYGGSGGSFSGSGSSSSF